MLERNRRNIGPIEQWIRRRRFLFILLNTLFTLTTIFVLLSSLMLVSLLLISLHGPNTKLNKNKVDFLQALRGFSIFKFCFVLFLKHQWNNNPENILLT